ncbi:MAG: hypothetical protein HRU75_15175 [Planctomycetia bacterium]|nr:MAG: hypothetical protein HRU75_15175 [Planctomycetia bacterium]
MSFPPFVSYVADSAQLTHLTATAVAAAVLATEVAIGGMMAIRSSIAWPLAAGLFSAFAAYHLLMLGIGDIRACNCFSYYVNREWAPGHLTMGVVCVLLAAESIRRSAGSTSSRRTSACCDAGLVTLPQ